MEMVAHDPAAAQRLKIAQSVGRDFVNADQAAGTHFPGKPRHKMIAEALRNR